MASRARAKKGEEKKATTPRSRKKDASVATIEPAAPAKPARGRSKAPVDLGRALVHAFRTNERINQFLLASLDPAVWRLDPPSERGRTIAAITAHVHNVRHMWLTVSAKDAPVPDKVDRKTLTIDEAKKALSDSAAAMVALLERSLEKGGHVPEFKPDVAGFLGYVISHEAHHRGQICLLARQLGHALPERVGYDLWEWRKRAGEVPAPVAAAT